ncbi:heavy metal translocating P-type ATPase [Uliginosibacterium paludis]|uniref:Heavy metal translocating P-type ATPase n=1 Tax=Uliginosibacterium paludis TaxID=1615952 RepID=A0ABV2CK78_9RHOO
MNVSGVESNPLSCEALSSDCFHCGLPVPEDATLLVRVEGISRRMCCAGCQAVCEAIVANGLEDYYRHRKSLPSPEMAVPSDLLALDVFDHEEFQKGFVRPLEGDEREADLILEGISCAACVWLNERHIAQLHGVCGIEVNYATRRARVRWRGEQIRLSAILKAVRSIGYSAHPYDPATSESLARDERRTALWRVFVAGFGMMQVMMYAYPAYIAHEGDMSPVAASLMRWASMVLTFPVVLYSAAPFFRRAWRDLRARYLGMDVPVALGVGAAFLASVTATISGKGEVYFDSVTMFVFFLLSARYLEMLARQRATRGAETLARLIPAFARRIGEGGIIEEGVPVSALKEGDVLLVRPGEVIVADGHVRRGGSEVDESWLTGESLPVPKAEGSEVLGGSVNGSGVLEYSAERLGDATRLATIRRLVERARSERPRIVVAADKVALWFTAALLLLAAITGLVWWQFDPDRALSVFVAVLVVSCPCALSLATPIALTVAADTLGRAGLLVTRTPAIEALAEVTHFAFDKTGTLTLGNLQLEEVRLAEGVTRESALVLAAALELNSEHLIGRALLEAVGDPRIQPAEQVEVVAGFGISGEVKGKACAIGRPEYVEGVVGLTLPATLRGETRATWVYLGEPGRWIAAFGLSDGVRPSARAAIGDLREAGASVSILSGDSQLAVDGVAGLLSVTDAKGGLSPEGKYSALKEMQISGAVVAMVGDGINDAPVLAQAQVSIAMAGGTDMARHQADVILLGDDLSKLVLGVRVAKLTRRIVRENLFWAFGYNILAIPAAATGLVSAWMAGLGMGLSSLLVVLNAMRIARGGVRKTWKPVSTS